MKNKEIIINDKNGNPIKEGEKFRFAYLEKLHKPIKLIGLFSWNQDELRYEIDILNNEDYTCLSYIGNGTMYEFELLPIKTKINEK
jgi:hypothetical protein